MKTNRSYKRKRYLYVVILSFFLISLSGCWSASEINNLAVVNVLAIDENKAGKMEVTAVIVKPNMIFTETGSTGGQKTKNPLIETTTGKSLYEAVGNLSKAVPESLYFGHLNVILFGERAAREKMTTALDFFKRQTDFRPNITVLVAKGPAQKLVQAVPIMNTTIGLELRDLAESNRFDETNMVQDISKFTEQLLSNTTDPYTGVIRTAAETGVNIPNNKHNMEKKKDPRGNKKKGSTKPKSTKPKMLGLSGTAVFKNGRLKGYLNERETQGLLAIKGELTNGIIVLDCGGNRKGTVSLAVKDTNSQLIPKLEGETPEMTVKVDVDAEIGDISCPGFNVNTASIDRLNQKLADYMKFSAMAVLNQAKNKWQTDIFGFGESIFRKDPATWNKLEDHWREGKLRQMDVNLKVSANILRHGLFKDSVKANESR